MQSANHITITPLAIAGFAPDAASVEAARDLADSPKWLESSREGSVISGRCRGSSIDDPPYRVRVEFGEHAPAGPAISCTCPSRKTPCKHALALLYRHIDGEDDD